jgi:hypothetical protein
MADEPITRVDTTPLEPPKLRAPGESPLGRLWSTVYRDQVRPAVLGLVVHTTGGGITNKAAREERPVLNLCAERYCVTRGCNYVGGYAGHEGGELVQVGSEFSKPKTAGIKDQLASIDAGHFERDLSPTAPKVWRAAWPDFKDPGALVKSVTGKRAVNTFYVGIEQPPCVWFDTKLNKTVTSAPPLRAGLRMTEAQHATVAALAVDLATRHKWPDGWWKTGRLLGHEDVSPMTRSTSTGCWDPGSRRPDPYWDWDYVIAAIEKAVG